MAERDNVVDLMPWDITLKTALEKRSASAILERDDADQIIAGLTELEAYYAVKSLGVDDATPFLAVMRPEQIAALIDLDVWHGGLLDVSDLLVWLGAFREAGVPRLVAAAHAIDPEVMALMLRRRLLIARKVRDDNGELLPEWASNPSEEILPLVETPDGRFIIAARPYDESDLLAMEDGDSSEPDEVDAEDRKSIVELVLDLYKHDDFEHIAGLLRMAETDLSSDVEETALRFRDARLEDLGFPSRERAMEVYALGDAERLVRAPEVLMDMEAEGVRLPAVHAQHAAEGLFHAAMRAIEDPATVRRIESELMSLSNAVLVADGVEPGELERIGEVLTRVRGTLELALAHRAGRELVQVARDRLTEFSLRALFSAGYGLTVRVASRARVLMKDEALAVGGRALGLLDDTDRAVLQALTRGPRPLYAEATATAPRAFVRPEDLARVSAVIDELEVWADVARHLELAASSIKLGTDVEPPEPLERTLGVLVGTLAANAVLAGPSDASAAVASGALSAGASGASSSLASGASSAGPSGASSSRPSGRAPSLSPLGAEGLARLGRILRDEGVEAAIARAAPAIATAAGRAPDEPAIASRVGRALREVADALVPLVGVQGGAEGLAERPIDPRFVGGLVRARR